MEEPFIRVHGKKILIALLGLLAVGIILYFSPLRSVFTSWRATSLLEEAQEFAEAGEWEEVDRTAGASMQLVPSLDALRLLTEAALNRGSGDAIAFAYQLFESPGASLTDKTLALKLALDIRDFSTASKFLAQLTAQELQDEQIHFQMVRGLIMTGQIAKAVQLADDPEITSDDPALDLLLVQGLLAEPGEGALAEATARLRRILRKEDRETALKAMSLLYSGPPKFLQKSLLENALARFQDDEELTVAQQLQLEAFKIALGEVDRAEVIEEAVRQYRESDLVTLLGWLTMLGEDERVLTLSNPPELREDEDIMRFRFGSLMNLQKWRQFQKELAESSPPYATPVLLALKSLLARRLDDRPASRRFWFKAMEAAENEQQRNWFHDLAQIAEQMDRRDDQMEAVYAGLQHVRSRIPGQDLLTELTSWLKDREENERLLALSERLVQLIPGNADLAHNYYLLKARHAELAESDLEAFRKLVERNPDDRKYRSSFVYLLLRADESEEALAELEEAWKALLDENKKPEIDFANRPLDPQEAFTIKRSFRAMNELRKWELIQKELDEAFVAYPKPRLLAVQSLLAHRLDDQALSDRRWSEAMEVAENEEDNWFFDLATLAAKMMQREKLMEAVLGGVLHEDFEPADLPRSELVPALSAWLQERGENELFLKVSRRLHELDPENPLFANNYYFLKALLRDIEESDLKTLQDLIDRFPKVLHLRSSFSFILLRAGQPERALAQLAKITDAGGELNPTGAAVKAKALEMLGRPAEAREASKAVDWDSLDADQRKFLDLESDPGPGS